MSLLLDLLDAVLSAYITCSLLAAAILLVVFSLGWFLLQ